MKRLLPLLIVMLTLTAYRAQAQQVRESVLLDKGWKFSLGHAGDPKKDFGCGTEYFNYLTKASSIHNEGPYSLKFDDTKWQDVQLPHDWVTTLPYAAEASHSHGYKTVGWKYPESSVGWYRKQFTIPATDLGKRLVLRFDGIFRSAQVWLNGFYMGTEPSGYATQVYDITPYVKYGKENLICVRADATLEEGWFYEGAGIYNSGLKTQLYEVEQRMLDAEGREVAHVSGFMYPILAKETRTCDHRIKISNPHLWSTTDPYLYKVETTVKVDDKVTDVYETTIGLRDIKFDAERGFLLNGEPLKLKGVNMHQDHAGVVAHQAA